MRERAEKILNDLFPEGATESPGGVTAHVYATHKDDEVVVWVEGDRELGHDALWQAFARVSKALEAGGFEHVEWKYRWKPRQAGGKFQAQSD